MPDEDRVVVAGHVEDAHGRPHRREAGGEGATAHLGHHDVGQQRVDRAGVVAAELLGVRGTGGLEHPVAVQVQDVARQRPDLGLVLHEQNRFPPLRAVPPACASRGGILFALDQG